MSDKSDLWLLVPAKFQSRHHCGEFHVAEALARGFANAGVTSRVIFERKWDQLSGDEPALLLRGPTAFYPKEGQRVLQWLIGAESLPDEAELSRHCANLIASPTWAVEAPRRKTLLQATEFVPAAVEHDNSVLFVGNAYRFRPAVRIALEARIAPRIIGTRWHKFNEASGYVEAERCENGDLTYLYASAGAVLNDHHDAMREHGFLSNRVYDVLAAGGRPVSDRPAGPLPDGFEEFVYFYEDAASMNEAVRSALSESRQMRRRRTEFAQHVAKVHSFGARAEEIISVVLAL